MNETECPFCEETINKPATDFFEACAQCGYRSARIESGDEYYLIVDSRLPNLMETFTSLQQRDSSSVIVIDRRIGQNPIGGADRRR